MTRSADSSVLLLLACFQLLLTGGLWVAWHLGLLTVPAALGAEPWVLHEVTFAAVPLLVAARGGMVPGGVAVMASVVAIWGAGRLVVTFLPEPPLWLVVIPAAALPALLAGFCVRARRVSGAVLLAGLAVAALLLHWEAWRYGTTASGWIAVAAAVALLPSASGGHWRIGVLGFLVLGLALLLGALVLASLPLERAALLALTLAAAGQALGGDRARITRGLAAVASLLLVAGLAVPAWLPLPLVMGGALWVLALLTAVWGQARR